MKLYQIGIRNKDIQVRLNNSESSFDLAFYNNRLFCCGRTESFC